VVLLAEPEPPREVPSYGEGAEAPPGIQVFGLSQPLERSRALSHSA